MSTQGINRVPRIKGLTRYPKSPTEKLSAFVSHHYINNNFTYLSYPLSITELSLLLQQNTLFLTQYIAEHTGIFTTLLSPKTKEEADKALVYLYDNLITFNLEDRLRMNGLVKEVIGQLWNPGNGALRPSTAYVLARFQELSTRSAQQMLEVIKSLRSQGQGSDNQGVMNRWLPSPGANSPNNLPLGQGEKAQLLTRKEAFQLIENISQNALINTSTQAALYAEEGISDTPEVAAIGTESEGRKSLKSSRMDLLSEEIILNIELPD